MFEMNAEVANRAKLLFPKAAIDLSSDFNTKDTDELSKHLYLTLYGYSLECQDEESTEPGWKAKEQLNIVATCAKSLSVAISGLGLLGRRSLIAAFHNNLNHPSIGKLDPTMLPDRYPRDPQADHKWTFELDSLAKLVNASIDELNNLSTSKGRKSFRTNIVGSPEEKLAEWCWKYAEKHGCHNKAAVQRMVQVIMEAQHGKKRMERQKDTKRSPDKGNKAVRKTARIKPNQETV